MARMAPVSAVPSRVGSGRQSYAPVPKAPDGELAMWSTDDTDDVCSNHSRRVCQDPYRSIALPFAGILVIAGAALVSLGATLRPQRLRPAVGTEMRVLAQGEHDCSTGEEITQKSSNEEEDNDYLSNVPLYQMDYVANASHCKEECQQQAHCGAWTWGRLHGMAGLTEVCFMKILDHGQRLTSLPQAGISPGLPCQLLDPTHERVDDLESQAAALFGTTTEKDETSVGTTMALVSSSTKSHAASSSSTKKAVTTTRTTTLPDRRAEKKRTSTAMPKPTAAKPKPTTATPKPTTAMPKPTTTKPKPEAGSLYCWSLMVPGSYEQDLVLEQHDLRESIFSCDAYSIYSNLVINLAPGVHTTFVDSDLLCKKGGEFNTALNTGIFITVWKQVITDGKYAHYAWTVKVDPDCVFRPALLRQVVVEHEGYPEFGSVGVYLNNCKYGLHGPLEVISSNAVRLWGHSTDRCVKHFEQLCSGDCGWGEDMFLDQCLSKVLKAKRVNEYRLLTEAHCDPPHGWQRCDNRTQVSFHPFKLPQDYVRCLGHAGGNTHKHYAPAEVGN